MCNLYSMTTTHEAMRKLFQVQSGINQLHLPGIFPDYQAPIVRRQINGERGLVMARWGMPTPPAFRKGPIDRGVTNIRNTASPHWRAWLTPQFRCLVPATSFCEPTEPGGAVYGGSKGGAGGAAGAGAGVAAAHRTGGRIARCWPKLPASSARLPRYSTLGA
jgi:putative SOS response-associated peptidase YedK